MRKASKLCLALAIICILLLFTLTSCSEKCTVKFDSNGGSEVAAQELAPGEFITEPNAPTRAGYTFAGWYRGDEEWSFKNYAVGMNMTLTARWIKNHTVTFDADNGTENKLLTVVGDGSIGAPQAPSKQGYKFIAWYLGDEEWSFTEDTVTSDITLVAKYKKYMTVTFNAAGGSLVSPATVPEGEAVSAPPSPLKAGFIFLGWYNGEEKWDFKTKLSEDITLVAKWTRQYVVYFDTDGAGTLDNAFVNGGELIPKPNAVTKPGYVFDHWYAASDTTMSAWDFASNKVEADITLKAKWKKLCTVSFETGEGSPIASIEVVEGDRISLPEAPSREFYLFDKWLFGENEWSFDTDTVADSMTLTAKWRANYYVVNFDTNGGSGDFPQQRVTLGDVITAPAALPEKADHAFISWTYNGQRWNFATDTVTVLSEITLIASWASDYYTVYFSIDGDTDTIPAQVIPKTGGLITPPSPAPTKPGFVLIGWNYGGAPWRFDISPTLPDGTEIMVLEAVWREQFTVSFDSDGGSAVDPITVTLGNRIPMPDAPIKTGHEFIGWYNGDTEWDFASDTVSSVITLTARWKKIYRADFELNGGSLDGASSIPPQIPGAAALITDPGTPIKAGYVFVAWQTAEGEDWDFTSDKLDGSITLYAKWRKIHTVSFNLNGGEGNFPPVTVLDGDKLIPSQIVPQKEHYVFDGWSRIGEDTAWVWSDPVTSDMVLVARWKPRVYIISFDMNGAEEAIVNQNISYGDLIEEPEPPYLDEYHAFRAWLDEDGNIWDFTKMPDRNMTLKADWYIIKTEGDTGNHQGPWVGVGTIGPPDVLD